MTQWLRALTAFAGAGDGFPTPIWRLTTSYNSSSSGSNKRPLLESQGPGTQVLYIHTYIHTNTHIKK